MTVEEIRSGIESRGTGKLTRYHDISVNILSSFRFDLSFSYIHTIWTESEYYLLCIHNVLCILIEALFFSLCTSELHGMDRTILMRALKLLEHKGKVAIFKGTSADDEGVKFSV